MDREPGNQHADHRGQTRGRPVDGSLAEPTAGDEETTPPERARPGQDRPLIGQQSMGHGEHRNQPRTSARAVTGDCQVGRAEAA